MWTYVEQANSTRNIWRRKAGGRNDISTFKILMSVAESAKVLPE